MYLYMDAKVPKYVIISHMHTYKSVIETEGLKTTHPFLKKSCLMGFEPVAFCVLSEPCEAVQYREYMYMYIHADLYM